MQKFVLGLLIAAIENEKIRAFLLEVVDRLAAMLLPRLASVIPVAIGAAAARFGDILGHVDLPGAPEIVEDIRNEVNHALPDGIDIPILSDAFRSATGFDLSDVIFGRK